MINGQKVLIDAAVAEKVPRFMPSDYTLDYRKLALGELPSKDPMMYVRDYLKDKPVKGIHLMIGAFFETFWQYLGLWDPQAYELKYWGTGEEKWDFTTYSTCAQYMAATSLDSEASGYLNCESGASACQSR